MASLSAYSAGCIRDMEYAGHGHFCMTPNSMGFQLCLTEDIPIKCILKPIGQLTSLIVDGVETKFEWNGEYVVAELKRQRSMIETDVTIIKVYILAQLLHGTLYEKWAEDPKKDIQIAYTGYADLRRVSFKGSPQLQLISTQLHTKESHESMIDRRSKTWIAGIKFPRGTYLRASAYGINYTNNTSDEEDYDAIEILYDIPHNKDYHIYPFCMADFVNFKYKIGTPSGINLGVEFYVTCEGDFEVFMMDHFL